MMSVVRMLPGSMVLLMVLLCCTSLACGRLYFDPLTAVSDGGDDSASNDGTTCDDAGCVTSCRTWSPFGPPMLVTAVMTAQDDVGPELSLDGLTLYVCTGAALFASTRATRLDAFSGRTTVPGIAGSACDPTLSGDGLEMIYDAGSPRTSLRMTTDSSWDPSTATPGLSTTTDGPWLSKDRLRVYTSSFTNNDDVVMASRTSRTGSFGPTTVVIGGTSSDSYPSLTADELTIAFSSNRGGADNNIWMATRESTVATFGAPFAVPELDSTALEWDPALTADGSTIVFASARNGNFDVFIATRTCLVPN